MQLEYAYLANFASFLQDGRLVVFGADIDGIESESFPAVAPALVMVAKFLLMPDEPLEGHTICVDMTAPSGERQNLCSNEPLKTMRNQKDCSRPSAAQVTINLMMVFDQPGVYSFHLSAGSEELKLIPFYVSGVATREPINAPSAGS